MVEIFAVGETAGVPLFRTFRAPPDNRAHRKAAMHTAAVDNEAHGQFIGSNRRFLLARLGGGSKRGGSKERYPRVPLAIGFQGHTKGPRDDDRRARMLRKSGFRTALAYLLTPCCGSDPSRCSRCGSRGIPQGRARRLRRRYRTGARPDGSPGRLRSARG